ncbi:MAG: exodeoxyribonuclease III [Legionellales bacterium]|nr:exodeoxyribonuclease III [Legionellales bacterium]
MKIASWNVNSLKVRLPQVLDWLAEQAPDILGLQELKLTDDMFPVEAFQSVGYHACYSGQKTYNGVALLSKTQPENVQIQMPNFPDPQQRVIAASYQDIRCINLYVPNGQSLDSDKYVYKLNWLEALTQYLTVELMQHPKLIVMGDFNIAPEDKDVHDPSAWIGDVLVSEPERAAWSTLLALGLHDSFRLFEQPEKLYSWWDYRNLAFRRNRGLRIDHLLVSDALKVSCHKSYIDKTPRKWERPSDHAPVICEI